MIHTNHTSLSRQIIKIEYKLLIPLKNISCINRFEYIVQARIVSICDDCLAFSFEFLQVVNDLAAVEGCIIFKGWFVNDDFSSFCFYPFHNALN